MAKIHNFKDSLVIGTLGETHILDYLHKNPNIKDIVDVRNDALYRKMDVDFVAIMSSGQELKIEIKTDSYKSGNIFYEWTSAVETDSIGCMQKTKADFLFYYFVNLDVLYILDMPAYRDWFETQKAMFDLLGYKKSLRNKRYNNTTYETVGYAFPTDILDDLSPRWLRKVYVSNS